MGPKIKSAQNLLKFGTFDISNIPILILVSKMIFSKAPVYEIFCKEYLIEEFNSLEKF